MDDQQETPEYLKTDEPQGFENVRTRDLAWALLHDLDYDSQIMAIRTQLSRQRQADEKLGDEIKRVESLGASERAVDQWDCHFFYGSEGKRQPNLTKGIVELAEAVGLAPYLPSDLSPILHALFEYRNKMFHCGFEWPLDERHKFEKRLKEATSKEGWSSDWFRSSTSGGTPWIFYLTDSFIDHCLNNIDLIIDGMGAYVEERLAAQHKRN